MLLSGLQKNIVRNIISIEDRFLPYMHGGDGIDFDEWKLGIQEMINNDEINSTDFLYFITTTNFNIRYPGHERKIDIGIGQMLNEILNREKNAWLYEQERNGYEKRIS